MLWALEALVLADTIQVPAGRFLSRMYVPALPGPAASLRRDISTDLSCRFSFPTPLAGKT